MMINPYRFFAFGLFVAFGFAVGGHFFAAGTPQEEEAAPPTLLAAALANPAEIAAADTLRRGETVTQLLARAELAEAESQVILDQLRQHRDPRRVSAGSVLSYRKSFATGDVRGLEMKLDPDNVLVARRDGAELVVAVEEVPVRTDTVVLTGTIESTLYNALARGDGAGVPVAERERVVDLLADRIFAWQVDFSRDLRKGDEIRVLYERVVRPDGTARSSRVLAVQLEARGRTHEAYLFRAPDGREDFYARDGGSMKRAFLRAPLEFRRISSAFSRSRFHPVLGVNRPHNGIDYAAASGTPVRAVGDGVITRAGWGGGYGNVVDIRHQQGYSSRYAHLRGFAPGIRTGSRVRQGDLIGYVGSTGMSTGPHLHYEFHANGRPVDPNSIKYLSGEPVPARHRAVFQNKVGLQLSYLDRWMDSLRLAEAPKPPTYNAPQLVE
jgi:murein DD-endopeptidase MepM/ murein hydrolase activator NlpD